jgi:CRISPR-associated protein Csb1
LLPDGGDGSKVFPPTYAGGVYAIEDRRIDGRVVRCVLLDSVQSQANRMEEALQDAFLPNWRGLPTNGNDPRCDLPVIAVKVGDHDWVTSLSAPHRIHDAILRDSDIDEKKDGQKKTRFRESEIGKAIRKSRLWDATAFYRYCPTTLLFGTWDSTAGEGLDSAKIPRAVVSEIIGVEITPGVRTHSRIDPLGIEKTAARIYRRKDGDWAAIVQDDSGEEKWIGAKSDDEIESGKGGLKKFGKDGKPSDINHGNVTPDLDRFGDNREVRKQHLDQLPDALRDQPVTLNYKLDSRDGRLDTNLKVDRPSIRAHGVKAGGVTLAYALHTWTLSLTQLRRLRFPLNGKSYAPAQKTDAQRRDEAARTVLAALALYALALQRERGYWLRSRCELIPQSDKEGEPIVLEQINTDGTSIDFGIPNTGSAKELLKQACEEAKEPQKADSGESKHSQAEAESMFLANPGWEQRVIRLTPTEKLAELVKASDRRRPDQEPEEQEAADANAES